MRISDWSSDVCSSDLVDRAAGGIAAIERPLRAAQNLDALGVESGKQRSDGAADIDAVEVERDAGIAACGAVLVTDPAQGHIGDRTEIAELDRRDRKSTRLNSSH